MKYLLLILIVLPTAAFPQSSIKSIKDTLSLQSKEFLLQNTSSTVRGVLLNKGNGATAFVVVGWNFQFIKGSSPEFQLQDDSLYTNAYLVNKSVKIWRNGLFQYTGTSDGVKFDRAQGKVIFSPPLTNGDKIYIEALEGF